MDVIYQHYQQHKQELRKHQEELQQLEENLANRKKEMEEEEKRLLVTKETLELERKDITRQQEELKQYLERIAQELEYLQQEKYQHPLQEENRTMEPQTEEVLEESRAEEEVEEEQKEKEQVPEEVTQQIDDVEPSDLIQRFAKEAERVFPEGSVLEATKESYCMSIEDKELRILMGDPPTAMILTKREKSRYLMKGITQLNRMQLEWKFTYEDNCLKCVMPFTEVIPAETILKKCAEAISLYFK